MGVLGAADGRIERPFGGQDGEIAAKMVQRGRLGFLFGLGRDHLWPRSGWRAALLALRQVAAEQAKRFGPRLFQGDTGIGENLGSDAFLLTQQSEQQVLGADVRVIQLACFHHRELEHLFGA